MGSGVEGMGEDGGGRRMMFNRSLFSSASGEWETPQELFDALDAEFHFTLDACATAENAKCPAYFTEDNDALKQDWAFWARPVSRPARVGCGIMEPCKCMCHPYNALIAMSGENPATLGLIPRNAMDSNLGAEHVIENVLGSNKPNEGAIPLNGSVSWPRSAGIPNRPRGGNANGFNREPTTIVGGRGFLTSPSNGHRMTGSAASKHGGSAAPIAEQTGSCGKTTSSRFLLQAAQALFPGTSCLPALDVGCQSIQSPLRNGARTNSALVQSCDTCKACVPQPKSIWVNCPYGRQVGLWVAKGHEASCRGVTTVMLLPSRTDTSWFQDYILPFADEIRFIRGRLKFSGAKTGAPFPSCIVVFRGKS